LLGNAKNLTFGYFWGTRRRTPEKIIALVIYKNLGEKAPHFSAGDESPNSFGDLPKKAFKQ
jgi:hypothetical protein